MDFGEGSQWTILIPIIVIIVLSFVMRRRKPAEKTEVDIVGSLFIDVSENLKLVEKFSFRGRPKKFQTGSWQRNSEKLDFLDSSLRSALDDAFGMAEDFNKEIEAAKKYKSTSYLSAISVDKLNAPLVKSKDGLEEWLKANMEKMGPGAGRRGCLGGGLGG